MSWRVIEGGEGVPARLTSGGMVLSECKKEAYRSLYEAAMKDDPACPVCGTREYGAVSCTRGAAGPRTSVTLLACSGCGVKTAKVTTGLGASKSSRYFEWA